MRRLVFGTALAMGVSTLPAAAVELNYKWKKGDVHRFQYEDVTTMAMEMSGMGDMGPGKEPVTLKSVFSEKVLKVGKDGKADVELTIEKMEVSQGDRKMAMLDKIPPAARVVKAEIDKKGHAKFFRMVAVYVQDDTVFLGVPKAEVSKNGASLKASGMGIQVELVASVDPKTGAVTSSLKYSDPPPPVLKKVEIKEDAQHVDVVPKEILEMMVLPDGDMAEGAHQTLDTMVGKMETIVGKVQGNVAKVQMKMGGKEVGTKTAQEATENTPGEGGEEAGDGMPSMPGMPGGMPGMRGMPGMPGMPTGVSPMPGMKPKMPGQHAKGGQGDGAPNMGMQMDADITVSFDVAAGKLLKMEGTTDSNMSMGGMGSVKIHSTPKLTRL